MNASQNALIAASQIEAQLLFENSDLPTGDEALQLLGFCLRQMGQRQIKLEPLAGASIVELLDYNDIHHRRVSAPRFPASGEFPLLIVFIHDEKRPLALFRHKGRNWYYCPREQQRFPASNELALTKEAYELYLSLPASVAGPWSLTSFALGTELPALVSLALTSAVVMLFNLSIPMLTNLLVERILPQSDKQLLLQGLIVVMLLVVGSVATQLLQNLMMLRIESVADLKLQTAVWDRLMRLPMVFINQFTTGDLSSRVNAISQLQQLLGTGILTTLLSSLFSISYFVLMFTYDAQLALWASLFTLIATVFVLYMTLRSIKLEMPLMESGAEITNFSLQSVMGMPQIRSSGAEPFVLLRWMREVNRYGLLQLRSNFYNDALEQYGTLVSPISSVPIFALVAYRILNSQSISELNQIIVAFIAFNAAFLSFNSSLTGAINVIANVAGKAAVLWQRAEPIMLAAVEHGYEPDALRHKLKGQFRFQEISYSHPGTSEPLFNNLSFNIEAGQHTAITGPSGCGKTTLVRMLLGFMKPDNGELLVDGIPLHQLAIRAYRRQMGVVMQTTRLNAGSIYEVICGGIERSEDEVWDALEKAAIAAEVREMPMRLETLLSDSGGNVSGGQVQRIAIARAFITNPKVLVMDEATSALDTLSQKVITSTIETMGITRISIAHRLATIQQADHIVVIEHGKAAEQGSWLDLMKCGYLARMLASN